MCFVLLWLAGFLDKAMQLWLSSNNCVAETWVNPISHSRLRKKTTSCAAVARATYSASVEDNATTGCFTDRQLIAALFF